VVTFTIDRPRVLRGISQTLQAEAERLFSLFEAMQEEVDSLTVRLQGQGTAIEVAGMQFSAMRPTFERIREDIQTYSRFLSSAADEYERIERDVIAQAQQQGRFN